MEDLTIFDKNGKTLHIADVICRFIQKIKLKRVSTQKLRAKKIN